MTKSQMRNVVRMDWLRNRTQSGRRSATNALKLAQYFALGRGRAQEQAERPQRGQWLDQHGRPCRHEDVLAWVQTQGMHHELTHQFILSVADIPLSPQAFNRALAAGGPLFHEWRLIAHTDSRYPHAHALAFGDRPVAIKSEAFQSWWRSVRRALTHELDAARVLQAKQALSQGTDQQLQSAALSKLSENEAAGETDNCQHQSLNVDTPFANNQAPQPDWDLEI